jgi:hypothetical protein
MIEAPYALAVDHGGQAGVLHQPSSFLDDSNAEASPYGFQLSFTAG